MLRAIYLFASLLILAGCGSSSSHPTSEATEVESFAADSPEAAARSYFEAQRSYSGDVALFSYPQHFMHQHHEEVANTYEVADVDTLGDLAAIYGRYSIGADVYREASYAVRREAKWYPHGSYFHISYDQEETMPEQLKVRWEEIEAKAESWEENGATVLNLIEVLQGTN